MEVGELLRLESVRQAGRDLWSGPSRVRTSEIRSYRSIWISDLHLGTHRCQSKALLDFLNHHEAENLFLVGDIVDLWNRGPQWFWNDAQTAVVDELRAWERRGTRVTVFPGNHDPDSAATLELLGLAHGEEERLYRTGDGRELLVIHGHQFDSKIAAGRWLQGAQAYSVALRLHEWYEHHWNERWQRPGSVSAYLRYRVKRAVEYFTDFDDRAIFEAVRARKADGVICGHIHRPEQRLIGPVWYINDGDWVESRTALIEKWDGSLQLLRWDPAAEDREDTMTPAGMVS